MCVERTSMPRPKHPLRALRAATPHRTQAAFAEFLGVPVRTVQAVENGQARMTPRMAARIREGTGADDVELRREDGRALTLSGRRYTEQAFIEWQGSAGQAEERRRREEQELSFAQAWSAHASRAGTSDADGECGSRALEDFLTPWQTCEYTSAVAKDWKKLPEARRRLTGWSDGITLRPDAQLTLAVQAAPVWDPASPPPGMAASNAELFPPCYFTVAAGSGGCRVAAAFWQAVRREHGICAQTGAPVHGAPTGSWRGFFRRTGERCEPHAVFTGLDAEERRVLGTLFADAGVLSGGAGDILTDEVLKFMQEHSEDAGSPAGILLFASLEGGTASALSSELLSRLRAQFPLMAIFVIGVLPLAGVSSVVTAPWHLALALQAIRRHASGALLFSNEQLLASATRDWHMASPGYAEANLLIAECLGALTAPLRFGGSDAQPVDLRTLLDGLGSPGMQLITAQCRPLAALADRRMKTVPLPWLMDRAIDRLGSAGAPALAAFLRVRLMPGDPWMQTSEPPAVSLSGRIGPGLHECAVVASDSPVIARTLRRLQRQARELLKLENAASLAAQIGVGMDELGDAVRSLGDEFQQ
jgi:transcriptional regulator with XRE-family HTH domain